MPLCFSSTLSTSFEHHPIRSKASKALALWERAGCGGVYTEQVKLSPKYQKAVKQFFVSLVMNF